MGVREGHEPCGADRAPQGLRGTSVAQGVAMSRYWISGFPGLVAEWDHERNVVTPDALLAGSSCKVWWRCAAGPDHRWRASANNRTSSGTGCPFCANKRVSVTNNLAAVSPIIAREWHPEKNGRTTPAEIVATSTRVAWWRCADDDSHAWRAVVRARTRFQSGCPFCARRRASRATSLAAERPDLSAEWDAARNAPLAPADVLPGASRVVWWRCSAAPSHVWRAAVANRVRRASGCPFCARRFTSLVA
jgi:hypothetical protein